MKLLHKIKFWIAQQRGLVAKKKIVQLVVASLTIAQQKKMLEEQFLIEKDPAKLAELDRQYIELEKREKTWQKTKI